VAASSGPKILYDELRIVHEARLESLCPGLPGPLRQLSLITFFQRKNYVGKTNWILTAVAHAQGRGATWLTQRTDLFDPSDLNAPVVCWPDYAVKRPRD
jgi:hypothetical protein